MAIWSLNALILVVATKTLALNLQLTTDRTFYQHLQTIFNQNFKHPTSNMHWMGVYNYILIIKGFFLIVHVMGCLPS